MATIRRLKSGRWQAQVRKQGYPQCTASFACRSDAQRWATQAEQDIERGAFVDRTKAIAIPIADLLDRYSREVTPTKRGARAEQARIRHLRDAFNGHSLGSISPSRVAQYRDERLAAGLSPSTVRRDLAVLSHAFEVAAKDFGMPIATNPVRLIRQPQMARARQRRLLQGEQERLLAALKDTLIVRDLVQLAIQTCCRRSELLGLQWDHVDFDRRVVHLLMTKNGEHRDVPLSSVAIQMLRARWEGADKPERGAVFAIRLDSVTQAFRRACARAGIQGLRFHDLRHEAVSRLFERGLSTVEVASISGHKSFAMLRRYTHLRATELASKLG